MANEVKSDSQVKPLSKSYSDLVDRVRCGEDVIGSDANIAAERITQLVNALQELVAVVEKEQDWDSQFGVGTVLDKSWAVLNWEG